MINAKFKPTGLYAITDDSNHLEDKVENCLKAGISLLQYRNKSAHWAVKLQQAQRLLQLCQQYQTPLIINDDIQLAQYIHADGVHLGQEDMTYEKARQQLGQQKIIGVSCYDQLDYALTMQQKGADYIAFGRFFPSQTKPLAKAVTMDILESAQTKIHIPIVAIGGITPQNGHQLVQKGANLLAVVGGLFAHQNQFNQVQQYQTCFEDI